MPSRDAGSLTARGRPLAATRCDHDKACKRLVMSQWKRKRCGKHSIAAGKRPGDHPQVE